MALKGCHSEGRAYASQLAVTRELGARSLRLDPCHPAMSDGFFRTCNDDYGLQPGLFLMAFAKTEIDGVVWPGQVMVAPESPEQPLG